MNTRLQVEHPTTEMITGLDLVELQLQIAADEPLPFAQSEITVSGWAIEARVNAEAPARNFQPETGRILLYGEPKGSAVRVDSGVKQGSEVTSWYDPLLAKGIAHGKDREEARTRLAAARRLAPRTAQVRAANDDGTFAIDYDDGEREEHVKANCVALAAAFRCFARMQYWLLGSLGMCVK